jgi:hypothetical protein
MNRNQDPVTVTALLTTAFGDPPTSSGGNSVSNAQQSLANEEGTGDSTSASFEDGQY